MCKHEFKYHPIYSNRFNTENFEISQCWKCSLWRTIKWYSGMFEGEEHRIVNDSFNIRELVWS